MGHKYTYNYELVCKSETGIYYRDLQHMFSVFPPTASQFSKGS